MWSSDTLSGWSLLFVLHRVLLNSPDWLGACSPPLHVPYHMTPHSHAAQAPTRYCISVSLKVSLSPVRFSVWGLIAHVSCYFPLSKSQLHFQTFVISVISNESYNMWLCGIGLSFHHVINALMIHSCLACQQTIPLCCQTVFCGMAVNRFVIHPLNKVKEWSPVGTALWNLKQFAVSCVLGDPAVQAPWKE